MNYARFAIALYCLSLALTAGPAGAQTPAPVTSATPQPSPSTVIGLPDVPPNQAAHNFFKAVLDKDYATSWALLTKKSQDGFIRAVAENAKVDQPSVAAMFAETSGEVSRGFWESLRGAITENTLKLALAAPAGTDAQEADTARVSFGKAPGVAMLMFKENGRWKLGYVETFFPKGLPKIPAPLP